ncbi:MAG TPA: histidine phosphatase family protein, partial [Kofleriaceae bacterium]
METTVFLIRHGVTAWHAEGRVLGQRDIPLSQPGIVQAEEAAAALRGVKMSEVLSSPLQRAIQTAEIIGQETGIEIARDPRLIDFQLGKWTGMTYADVAKNEEYQRFVQQPESERIPGGESLEDIRRRAVAAVDQALRDNATGDALAIVTHAGIIRVLIT